MATEDTAGQKDVLAQVDALVKKMPVTPAQPHVDGADPQAEGETQPGYWQSRVYALPAYLERPPKQWLVQQILGAQDFGLVIGDSGHGKTHVCLDLSFACATGGVFAGRFDVVRPLTVCYATGEGSSGLADRLRAVQSWYGVQDVPITIIPDVPQLWQAALVPNGVLAFLHEWRLLAGAGLVPAQLDVLVLDTLHNATAGADENSAGDAGKTLESLRRLRDELGCAVVLAHHTARSTGLERGSTAFRASMDTVIKSGKTGKSYTLSCEKLKDGEPWPAQQFSLVPELESVRISWDGDAKGTSRQDESIGARVLAFLHEHAGRRYTASELAQEVLGDETKANAVLGALERLKKAGSVWQETEHRHAGAVQREVKVWFVPAK